MRRKSQSDRAMASVFGVSHTCIANWRREFVAIGNLLPTEFHEGRDGKTYSTRRPTTMYATTPTTATRAAELLNELGDDAPGRELSPRAAEKLVLGRRKELADARAIPTRGKSDIHEGRFQEAGRRRNPTAASRRSTSQDSAEADGCPA
jgi:hypothetical protein